LMSLLRAIVVACLMWLIVAASCIPVSGNPISREDGVFQKIVDELVDILEFIKEVALDIGRILSGTLIAVGVVLWASDIFSYKGRKLITSGVILYFILELLS